MSTTISGASSMAPADHSRRRSMYPRRSNSVPPAPSSTTAGPAASNSVNFPNATTSAARHDVVEQIRVCILQALDDLGLGDGVRRVVRGSPPPRDWRTFAGPLDHIDV